MGCFTRDVAYTAAGHVITVHAATAAAADACTLTKEMSIELPAAVDADDVSVTYAGGVVTIRAPVSRRRRDLARSAATGSATGSSDSSSSCASSSS